LFTVVDHGADRDHRRPGGALDVVNAAEHLGPKASVAVVEFGLHLHGSRLRVDGVGDARHAAREPFARIRHEADLDTLTHLHEPDVGLRHLPGPPHRRETGDRHQRSAGNWGGRTVSWRTLRESGGGTTTW